MRRLLSVILLISGTWVAGVALVSAATDEQKAALKSDCRSDFIAHCRGVKPGGIPAFECLSKNVDSLSSSCQTAVKAVDPEAK